jgi:hypothetical protein
MKLRTFYTLGLLIVTILVITLFKSFWTVCYADGLNDFSFVISFSDLHQTEKLKVARDALNGVSGVYCITHTVSETMYVGSSVDIGLRLMDHMFYGSTNPHLLNAIAKYGLAAFVFSILEFCSKKALLEREQFYLDKLFSLPEEKRYNILPQAVSSLGYKHKDETKAKISESMKGNTNTKAMKGESNPMYGVRDSAHPSFGLVPVNVVSVNVYNAKDNTLVQSFHSFAAAAKFLNVSYQTVSRHAKSGKILSNRYIIKIGPIS